MMVKSAPSPFFWNWFLQAKNPVLELDFSNLFFQNSSTDQQERLKSRGLKSSATFQKGSPLVPFFKYAYGKLRQTGTLARIKQKWEKKGTSGNCGSNQLRPISFNKIASVIVLLLLGMSIAFLISVIEIFYKRRAEANIIQDWDTGGGQFSLPPFGLPPVHDWHLKKPWPTQLSCDLICLSIFEIIKNNLLLKQFETYVSIHIFFNKAKTWQSIQHGDYFGHLSLSVI